MIPDRLNRTAFFEILAFLNLNIDRFSGLGQRALVHKRFIRQFRGILFSKSTRFVTNKVLPDLVLDLRELGQMGFIDLGQAENIRPPIAANGSGNAVCLLQAERRVDELPRSRADASHVSSRPRKRPGINRLLVFLIEQLFPAKIPLFDSCQIPLGR